MLFFDRRKQKNRRSRKNRRKDGVSEYEGHEKRKAKDRRSGAERRDPKDRRSDAYHRLPEDKRDSINRTIEIMIKEESIEEFEKRKEDRYLCKASELAHVNIVIKEGSGKSHVYDLKVKDCSKGGIGIEITMKNFNLIKSVDIGDQLQNVSFFSPWAVMKIDGTVAHKTIIQGDNESDLYILGLKSEETIENYRPTIH